MVKNSSKVCSIWAEPRALACADVVGVVAVIDEEDIVRRADHVEVEVERDLVELLLREVGDVVRRPDEVRLLSAPPREANGVLRLDLAQLLADLEQGGRAAAVVVDAGSSVDRVEVCAGHDDVVRVLTGKLGQHVGGRGHLAHGLGLEPKHQPGGRGQLLTRACVIPTTGMSSVNVLPKVPLSSPRDVVVDDDPDRTGIVGIGRLDGERAGAARDQGDVPGGEAGEVGGLAPAVLRPPGLRGGLSPEP